VPVSRLATPEGTARYRGRFPHLPRDHFRTFYHLTVSSIGIGTYLGDLSEATDRMQEQALVDAVLGGINLIDTASTYRCQRAERAVGRALKRLEEEHGVTRDEIVVVTKGGLLAFDGAPPDDVAAWFHDSIAAPGLATLEDLAGGYSLLTLPFIQNALARSLENLGLPGVDVYLLHNVEMQLDRVAKGQMKDLITPLFAWLEGEADAGRVGRYGVATWDALRGDFKDPHYLSLAALQAMAKQAAGEGKRPRLGFVELPLNLGMAEGFTRFNQATGEGNVASAVMAAHQLGLTVLTSVPLMQGQLAAGVPEPLAALTPNLTHPAQHALQFARSTPGVGTAVVGLKAPEHVAQALAVAAVGPLKRQDYLTLFQRAE